MKFPDLNLDKFKEDLKRTIARAVKKELLTLLRAWCDHELEELDKEKDDQ